MKNTDYPSRRQFLKTSIAAPVAIAGATFSSPAFGSDLRNDKSALPRRKLGRNGPEVTMIAMGGSMTAHSPQFLEMAWANGVRYFDTSPNYINGRSEKNIGEWIAMNPDRRKDLFLVTKQNSHGGPEEMWEMLDKRLEICQTDYIDLYFMHGLGVDRHGKDSINWPKSDRFRKVVEKLKESGKVRMVGFSCHHEELPTYLNHATEGGFLDAIMLKYNMHFTKGDELDQAMDRAYDQGIGLVCMKEMRPYANAPKITPELEKVGLTTQQAVLHKVWSDKRISAICSKMDNIAQIEENCAAARLYKNPLAPEQVKSLQEVAALSKAPMCPGCASCTEGSRHTDLAFADISRYVCYYEQDGDVSARERYRKLPSWRKQVAGTDLAALRDGCQYKVDYPEILRRAESYFA